MLSNGSDSNCCRMTKVAARAGPGIKSLSHSHTHTHIGEYSTDSSEYSLDSFIKAKAKAHFD